MSREANLLLKECERRKVEIALSLVDNPAKDFAEYQRRVGQAQTCDEMKVFVKTINKQDNPEDQDD